MSTAPFVELSPEPRGELVCPKCGEKGYEKFKASRGRYYREYCHPKIGTYCYIGRVDFKRERIPHPKVCSKCGTKLNESNWRPSTRNQKRYLCDDCLCAASRPRSRAWRLKYPERQARSSKNYTTRLRKLWGYAQARHHMSKRVIESELFAANHILPLHGFTDILLLRPMNATFPFDIFARKDGQIYAIDVTMHYGKKLDPRKLPFLKYLNLKPAACFIKPDFTWGTIKEFKTLSLWVAHEFLASRGEP